MGLREIITDIASGWPAYRASRTVNANNEIDRLVTKAFPAELKRIIGAHTGLLHEGSSGLGNVSAAPWVATFDLRLTRTAQEGYYPVYLFSTELDRVYLSFGLGVTQFDRQFGENNASIDKMRRAAAKVRALCDHLTVPGRLGQTEIDLATSNSPRRYKAYEAATIFAHPPYIIHDLPTNTDLESDYVNVVKFYLRLVADPVIPAVQELVESAIDSVDEPLTPEVSTFEPRPPAKGRTSGTSSGRQRRSSGSLKVGNAGERAVIEAERQKLIACGRPDLADEIDHLAARGQTPGWDITSFSESGEPIYIEVKASTGGAINSIELTRNEWLAAQEPKRRGRYHIYLVTKALSSNPRIEILTDPFAHVKKGKLSIMTSVWELSLRSRN